MINLRFVCGLLSLIHASGAYANEAIGPATTLLVRGKIQAQSDGKSDRIAVKKGDQISSNSTLFSEKKSFGRFELFDQTILSLGPNSQIILKANPKDSPANVLNLIGGKVRAKVIREGRKNQEKMVIRTQTAAMGVRGTEFVIEYDAANDRVSIATIEGEVSFARIPAGASLEQAVEALLGGERVLVAAGRMSSLQPGQASPSRPEAIPLDQLRKLREDKDSFIPYDFDRRGQTNDRRRNRRRGRFGGAPGERLRINDPNANPDSTLPPPPSADSPTLAPQPGQIGSPDGSTNINDASRPRAPGPVTPEDLIGVSAPPPGSGGPTGPISGAHRRPGPPGAPPPPTAGQDGAGAPPPPPPGSMPPPPMGMK